MEFSAKSNHYERRKPNSNLCLLIGQAVDVWRPVQAIEKGQGLYQIVSENLAPDDEKWEFTTGDIVHVNEKSFSDSRRGLVAVEKVDISLKNSEC